MGDKTGQNVTPFNGKNGNDSPTRSGFIEKYGPIVRGGYRADFSRDTRIHPAVYHYIISREDSRDILVFAQAHTLEEARTQARKEIENLLGLQRAESAESAS